jgi:hypothetical protein
MNDHQSILEFLHLPDEFGITLLLIALALFFAAFFEGVKIGDIEVELKPKTRKVLKWCSIPLLVIALGLHYPSIPPDCSGSIQNFEANNGTPGAGTIADYCRPTWNAGCEFNAEETHNGKRSLRVHVEKHQKADESGGTVRIHASSKTPLDLSKAAAVSAWVFDVQRANTVEIKLCNGDNCPDRVWSSKQSTKDAWTELSWPMSNFKNVDKTSITGIEFYERNDGVYYFDDVSWE